MNLGLTEYARAHVRAESSHLNQPVMEPLRAEGNFSTPNAPDTRYISGYQCPTCGAKAIGIPHQKSDGKTRGAWSFRFPVSANSTVRCFACEALAPAQAQMPAPQHLSATLIDEGRAIPVARVQAMHEGKRRAQARKG